MEELNYQALVPVLRALLGEDGRCLNCGHPFLNERDMQLEHRAPPRHPQDWARLHARNITILCGSCNLAKGDKPYDPWLDDEEDARRSANARMGFDEELSEPLQLDLFVGAAA